MQHIGKYTYYYLSTSRRIGKKVSNSKVKVGRLNPRSGVIEIAPDYAHDADVQEFIALKRKSGMCVSIGESAGALFTASDISGGSVLSLGSQAIMGQAFASMGLGAILDTCFGGLSGGIRALASFLAVEGDPLMYARLWLEGVDQNLVLPQEMDSRRISELLRAIPTGDCDSFYAEWARHVSEGEYLALDITSVSTWSELTGMSGWGYNRDGEGLAQINLCLVSGMKSRLPVMIEPYEGELKDVSTFLNMLSLLSEDVRDRCTIVTDKGFASKKNIESMLSDIPAKFLTSLPYTMDVPDMMIRRAVREGIRDSRNTHLIGNDIIQMLTFEEEWPYNRAHTLFFHVFLDSRVEHDAIQRKDLKLSALYRKIEESQEKARADKDVLSFFTVRKRYGGNDGEYSFTLKEDAVRKELRHAGWLVCVSNTIRDPLEAIRMYRDKDVVEKGHDTFKNHLGISRLRVHGDKSMKGLVMVSFIALIVRTWVHVRMDKAGLYRKYTMKELFKTVDTHHVHIIRGSRIVSPATKQQKAIYKAMGCTPPGSECITMNVG
jgi:transposase